jgi:hypothetical protein
MPHPDRELLALGIQQPWAELILRGIKTIEVRNVPTPPKGPIFLYASRRLSSLPAAETAIERYELDQESLPLGKVVGTVHIVESRKALPRDAEAACIPAPLLVGKQSWILADPERCPEPLPVRFRPYGMWFYPFRRRPAE